MSLCVFLWRITPTIWTDISITEKLLIGPGKVYNYFTEKYLNLNISLISVYLDYLEILFAVLGFWFASFFLASEETEALSTELMPIYYISTYGNI